MHRLVRETVGNPLQDADIRCSHPTTELYHPLRRIGLYHCQEKSSRTVLDVHTSLFRCLVYHIIRLIGIVLSSSLCWPPPYAPCRYLYAPTASGMQPPSDSEANARKRVCKACDRCRMKKSKCDGSKPCNRCQTDDSVCRYGDRKKSQDKQHPKGCAAVI